MKNKKNINDYKAEFENANDEECENKELDHKSYLAEIEFIAEREHCTVNEVRLVYLAAIGEIVIYSKDVFSGYLDSQFKVEMDYFNHSKL